MNVRRFSFASVSLVALIAVNAVVACSCLAPPPAPQALQQSTAVFLGKVVAIEAGNGGQLSVTLDVERWWKGGEAGQVKVATANNGAACGFGFQKDGRYLVYASSGLNNGPWRVSLCSRSSNALAAQAADDQKVLGAGTAPKGK